jgi:Flp pilus assembly protein TadG
VLVLEHGESVRLASFFTLIARFWANRQGNVLPLMALVMLLLVSFVGCGIDGARMYMVNARLQQACDAGVLAGRKAMVDTSLTNLALDTTASAAANSFFNNNFRVGTFGTTAVSFTPAKTADAQVSGRAVATMPMTLMRIFGYSSINITVVCQGTFYVNDTDVMFVLDTTGSMSCAPFDDETTCNNYVGSAGTTTYIRPADGSGSGNTSILGYPGSTAYFVPEKSGSRIAAVRTAVLSFYDTLAAAVDPTVHVRYGFVTYTSTVNAGRAIVDRNPAYLVGGVGSVNTSWTYQTRYQSGTSWGTPIWQYQPVAYPLTTYIPGLPNDDPTKTGINNIAWTGCIEERQTTAGASSFSLSALPYDLDPDLVPTSDIRTQWKPMAPEVIYARNYFGSSAYASSTGDSTSHPNLGTYPWPTYGYVSCGKPVSRLTAKTRSEVSAYVNASDFKPMGGTYHDTGMIWANRLLSPNGIFASDTAAWSGHQPPSRVIVFLTDGDMAPNQNIYGMYGLEYLDQRVSGGNLGNLKAYHNARFLAECAVAKSKNISVWTVSIAPAATAEMQQCASSPAQALYSTSGSTLADQFAKIAAQIAKLRISQ